MSVRPCPQPDSGPGDHRRQAATRGWGLRRGGRAALALAAAGTLVAAAGCGSPAPKPRARATTTSVSFPDTPAGTQASWLFGAVKHVPIPDSELTTHFDSTFLAQVPPAKLNSVLAGVGGLRLDSIPLSTADAISFDVTANGATKLNVNMAVDTRGLIEGLVLKPATATPTPTVPTSWSGVDQAVRSVAPQVRLLVASVNGGTCSPIQAIDAGSPAPLGSAFKLYVLDALARAIAAGKVSWNQQLTITSQVKSLPSGNLQYDPDGTRISVRNVASNMISISDNTAANMLLALVGRDAVEAATRATGMADPALDVPFLNTRELFVLKLDDWPTLADRYLAQDAAGRQAMLTGTVDRVPTSTLDALDASAWTAPRDIGSLEWFASPTDICHVYASLAALAKQPKLAPVGQILSENNGGMTLPASQWQTVWFKGGSEPGVLTLNYLATTRTGHTYLVSAMAANPTKAFGQTQAATTLIGAIEGAFALAAR
jgi:Beta-lactamase enzyme family/ORF 12 gene product N-terminal